MSKWWETKGHLDVKNNRLRIAGVLAQSLANEFGTPLYVYNAQRIHDNYARLFDAFKQTGSDFSVHYAMKANSHPAILKLFKGLGTGIDAVSPNEVRLAQSCGFKSSDILFSGTSVSNADLDELIPTGATINIDSFSQLRRMKARKFDGAASIRWNPGLGAGLHSHTITGGKFIKFGIPEKQLSRAFAQARQAGLRIIGLHQHIGSGWLGNDVHLFGKTVNKTIRMAQMAQRILGYELEFVDFGGGPGICYRQTQKQFPILTYANTIAQAMKKSGLSAKIIIEPGRYLVGDAGVLLVNVNTVEQKNVPVLGVDSGFNHLVRPAFYGAYHEIVNASRIASPENEKYLVAGNLCESGDVFNENRFTLRKLPRTREGDTLAILNAGAYGMAMASVYNLRGRPAEVLLENKKPRLITKRESFAHLLSP